jgi:hypothetical protein
MSLLKVLLLLIILLIIHKNNSNVLPTYQLKLSPFYDIINSINNNNNNNNIKKIKDNLINTYNKCKDNVISSLKFKIKIDNNNNNFLDSLDDHNSEALKLVYKIRFNKNNT